ncbi:MAG TPA: type II toxin-antitoxin system HicB family antitoxin [Ktedonobacteraceae bacterium]|jgi:predicted RNase H-like HicB family nuclease
MASTQSRYNEEEYQTIVVPELLQDGRLIYVASHPELRGILAQGDSPEQALRYLSEVFADYVRHCAEYNLAMTVPQPRPFRRLVLPAIQTVHSSAVTTRHTPDYAGQDMVLSVSAV